MPTGTLLIIDDEARLRQLLARVLKLEGTPCSRPPTQLETDTNHYFTAPTTRSASTKGFKSKYMVR